MSTISKNSNIQKPSGRSNKHDPNGECASGLSTPPDASSSDGKMMKFMISFSPTEKSKDTLVCEKYKKFLILACKQMTISENEDGTIDFMTDDPTPLLKIIGIDHLTKGEKKQVFAINCMNENFIFTFCDTTPTIVAKPLKIQMVHGLIIKSIKSLSNINQGKDGITNLPIDPLNIMCFEDRQMKIKNMIIHNLKTLGVPSETIATLMKHSSWANTYKVFRWDSDKDPWNNTERPCTFNHSNKTCTKEYWDKALENIQLLIKCYEDIIQVLLKNMEDRQIKHIEISKENLETFKQDLMKKNSKPRHDHSVQHDHRVHRVQHDHRGNRFAPLRVECPQTIKEIQERFIDFVKDKKGTVKSVELQSFYKINGPSKKVVEGKTVKEIIKSTCNDDGPLKCVKGNKPSDNIIKLK